MADVVNHVFPVRGEDKKRPALMHVLPDGVIRRRQQKNSYPSMPRPDQSQDDSFLDPEQQRNARIKVNDYLFGRVIISAAENHE